MLWVKLVTCGAIGTLVMIGLYVYLVPYLFGSWYRTGNDEEMAFLTKRGAKNYPRHWAIDPYNRGLHGPIVFRPGKLLRRTPRR